MDSVLKWSNNTLEILQQLQHLLIRNLATFYLLEIQLNSYATADVKGTLIQIWKLSLCWCPWKNNNVKILHSLSEEFLSYLPVKFVNVLKSRLIFHIFYCFWMFVNKLFTYLMCAYLKSKRCFNVKSSTYYFHMKTTSLAI